jgi:folate-binding protein YgfZ
MIDEPFDAVRAGFDSLCGDGGAAVIARDVVAVQGPDAASYLQGQVSQDIVAMTSAGVWSFILQPTGKVDAWLRVHRVADDEFLLEVEPGHGEELAVRVRRFLIRTKATISDPGTRWLVAQRWGSDRAVSALDVPGALLGAPVGPGVAGIDVLVASEAEAESIAAGLGAVPAAALERYRIAHGVPAMGAELTADTIPGEAGAWVIASSVSFTKGCYTGQELVARIDSRGGNVPRPIRLLTFPDAPVGEAPAAGDEVRLDGVAVGSITSASRALGPAHPALALGPLARIVEIGAAVEVLGNGGVLRGLVAEPPVTS